MRNTLDSIARGVVIAAALSLLPACERTEVPTEQLPEPTLVQAPQDNPRELVTMVIHGEVEYVAIEGDVEYVNLDGTTGRFDIQVYSINTGTGSYRILIPEDLRGKHPTHIATAYETRSIAFLSELGVQGVQSAGYAELPGIDGVAKDH
tara:strand:- start:2776 stop:3222 length:447 start_codon:yes stop_codon:yes gene_type:complete